MDYTKGFERFQDPVGFWYRNLSDYEKKALDRIKHEYTTNLDIFFDREREDIYQKIQYYLTPLAKSIELQNLDNHIRVDLDYNDAYHDVLKEFTNEIDSEKYLQFAFAYQILEDSTRGMRVLRNISTRNIIKLCLKELDVAERNYFLPKFGDVFKDKRSEKFYFFCVKHWLNKESKPLTILSYLYYKFSEKNIENMLEYSKDLDFTIICSQKKYARWWNDNKIHIHPEGSYIINFRWDTGGVSLKHIHSMPNIDTYHTKFNSLKSDFFKRMHKNT